MPRDIQIAGEMLVKVKGNLGSNIATLSELGLTEGPIRIIPTYYHQDLLVDDYGPNVPANVLQNLLECRIVMNLIHYDPDVLDTCLAESLGGGTFGTIAFGAGQPLGDLGPRFGGTNHFISLNLVSDLDGVTNKNWRFLTTYLCEQPEEYPIGTEKTVVRLNWRAIPYFDQVGGDPDLSGPTLNQTTEIQSSGVVVFDHDLDD